MRSITKSQLFSEVADVANANGAETIDEPEVRAVLEALVEVVENEIANGFPVNVPGLVNFRLSFREAKPKRLGRNPATGEELMLQPKPAEIKLRARPIRALSDCVPSTRSTVGREMAAQARRAAKKRR